jgi:hypothetical protein
MLFALAAATAAMVAMAPGAHASGLSAGDVVVYRVGNGGSLGSAAVPVFFDEYDSSGELVESIALPTATSAPNHRFTASGSASSEGLLTLSANGQYLIGTGYDAALGTSKVGETANPGVARTLARVSASGEINTTTALTDVSNENNARGAASNDGNEFWWSGAGKKTSGGVHFATLGASTSTLMSTSDENARAVAIFNGQLYTSADPTKEGNTISTVGTGLPTTSTTTTNLPFATAPAEPYAFTMLTLGLGAGPDTMYVADNSAGAIVKFGLSSGKWVKEGSVAVSSVTGVTADDTNGSVTIYATSSGSSGEGGVLEKITDNSGVGGTLTGSATQIATAPAGEAFRGVAFTPGTTFGSGGTPPPPAPTITPEETSLAAAIGDPTNPTLGLKVADEGVEASELTVSASSSNKSVAPSVEVSGSGATRTLTVTPGETVGHSTITLTVKAPEGGEVSTTIDYGLSANQGDESDRYYAGAGNGSTAIDVGAGYMVLADDENNVLRLYHERNSGEPVKTFDFSKVLPNGAAEIDIEASARSGNTLYWLGSLTNKNSGNPAPERDIVFAATITGSGANTELTYVGSYKHLREDIVEWDEANGNPLGLAASTASGKEPKQIDGFNAEGLEFAPGSTSTAYLAFRAPLEPPNSRKDALLIPVTNFSSLVTDGNPGSAKATFGSPLEWNLGGLGLRELRKNAADEYLAIAGTSDGSNSSFGLYEWDGNPADRPVLIETPLPPVNEGAWEDIVSVPDPIADGSTVELLEDNGDSVWYADGLTSKTGMPAGLQKDLGRVFTIALHAPPVPATPGTPQLTSGANPNNDGVFTLNWEASVTPGVTYTLQHENAEGGWSDVASGLSGPEYAFTLGGPEVEGTWAYRAIADGAKADSEPSGASSAVKVDETAPNAPTASADRAPDYAGGGGWFKDTVTVSFIDNGDPALSDGSAGSGVNAASLSAPETFTTDGAHLASGTVSDDVGNESAPGTLAVQVDSSPPSLQVSCPATATVGAKGVFATVSASDGQSGLAVDPSGTVPIDTSTAGAKTVTRTATDNVGHSTVESCTTEVEHDHVITGTVKGTLTVRAGEDVELAPGARVTGTVKVTAGGALDVDGATLAGTLSAKGASSLRICGATIAGAVKAIAGSGPVVIGDGTGECAASSFGGAVTVRGNSDGVSIAGVALSGENEFHGALTVSTNSGGTTITNNAVAGSLTVKGNLAPVVDTPNSVEGKSKLQ